MNKRNVFYHRTFRISLFIKGFDGVLEFVSGLLLFLTSIDTLLAKVTTFFAGELAEDRTDFIANLVIGIVQHLSIGTKNFIALYLIIDGAIKIGLVIFLLRKKLWAYPVAGILLSLFVIYQFYRLIFISFSFYLLLLTLVDIIIIALLRFEYRTAKKSIRRQAVLN